MQISWTTSWPSTAVIDPRAVAGVAVQHAVAALRLEALVYEEAHWCARGSTFYGDHLLYERLRDSARSKADSLGERAVGLFGEQLVRTLLLRDEMASCPGAQLACSAGDPLACAIAAAQHGLSAVESAMAECDAAGVLTGGFEDLLMSLMSDSEEASYLLGQRASQ